MSPTVHFLLFTGFIIALIKSAVCANFYDWGVERSSVNPLSYTEEIRYSRDRSTQSPSFAFIGKSLKCPENEQLTRCDADCQKTCDNYKEKNRCSRACVWGCVCKSGFVRGPDNNCIKYRDCPTKPNAEAEHSFVTLNPPPYTDDDYRIPETRIKVPLSETESPLYEETLIPPLSHKKFYATLNPTYYTDVDYPDSTTKNPQFEDTEIPPITQTEPSNKCPPRERHVPCGGHCQKNCTNKDDEYFRCRPVCIPGCICEDGLVRGPNGKCIEKDKCPENADSEWDSSVTLNPPPYTDDDYLIPSAGTRNPFDSETDNPQFEETEIPSMSHTKPSNKCPPRERHVPCGGHCQRNCTNKDDEDFGCRPVCIPGCICEDGLVRGPNGKCIEKDKCPENSDSESDDVTQYNNDRIEEADQLPNHWVDYKDKSQELGYKTEDPRDNIHVTGEGFTRYSFVSNEETDEWPYHWGNYEDKTLESEYKTEDPRDQYPITRDDLFLAGDNPCPDDKTCRKLCRLTIEMKGGECVGPNNMTCRCY